MQDIILDVPHLLYRIGLHLLIEEEMDLDLALVISQSKSIVMNLLDIG